MDMELLSQIPTCTVDSINAQLKALTNTPRGTVTLFRNYFEKLYKDHITLFSGKLSL